MAISALWGVFTWFVFHRFTNHAALRKVGKRLYAHLLEIRLYSEEPSLVWSAQKALIGDNLHFLALIARPVFIMALPFAALYSQLDAIYGWRPLEVGRAAVVSLQLAGDAAANDGDYILHTPSGIAVETPAVRVFADRQISWRIRALSHVSGNLNVIVAGTTLSRNIAAGGRTLSPNRPRESPPGVKWIDVNYPRADVEIAGLFLPWLAWFLIISTVCAAVLTLLPRNSFNAG